MSIGYLPDTWKGLPVVKYNDRLEELVSLMPAFEMRSFGQGDFENQLLKQVVRLPAKESPYEIPVGVVSWNYNLIQHVQAVNRLRAGLQEASIEENLAECTLYQSSYGERMKLWIALHGLDFDPGDGHPLRVVVSCQNSVEGSCALEIKVIQVRWVCVNGMILGKGGVLRKTHIPQKLDQKEIARHLRGYLTWLAKEQIIYSTWLKTIIDPEQINSWVDTTVAKKWGNQAAARVASICRAGYNGKVQSLKDQPPSYWPVGWDQIVPGACAPVNNVYHAAQALSWIASHRPDLDERSERMDAIPEMVKELTDNL